SDTPWRSMVDSGRLPISVTDIIRLMLGSNLDVTVNRFSPLATQYIIQTLFRPFEPTLDISATVRRSTVPTASQLVGAAALTQLIMTDVEQTTAFLVNAPPDICADHTAESRRTTIHSIKAHFLICECSDE